MPARILAAAILVISPATVVLGQTPCEHLKSLSLPNTVITAAESIPAGPYLPIGLPADPTVTPGTAPSGPGPCTTSSMRTVSNGRPTLRRSGFPTLRS